MKRETVLKNHYLGERAVIVGSGIAGLSAARAVADRFRQVVIVDRDELPKAPLLGREFPKVSTRTAC